MDWKSVGARIQEARNAKHWTQEQLASAVDLSTQHISVLERGKKPPSLETLIIIANELGVSADMLLQDVVDRSALGAACELAELLKKQPVELQRQVMKVVRTMIE